MIGLKRSAWLLAASLWLTACASRPVVTEAPAPLPPPPALPTLEQFQADSLFAFGKAGIDDVSAQGLASLDALAGRLQQITQPVKVDVVGHSDRIGSPRLNADLSHRRARAVREYLIALGVAPQTISASGRGSAEPVVECPDERGQALVACLAPNRRVDVHIRYEP